MMGKAREVVMIIPVKPAPKLINLVTGEAIILNLQVITILGN
jgi:hypothetical protein